MLSTPCRIRKTHGCCFIFSLCLFLGKLHVMQQDRYSVWAQSTELEYCTITPPLSLCALVETPHTKKGLLPRAPCLRKYFSKRVFFGMAVSVHGGDQKPKLIKFRTMLTRCQRESPPFTVSKISLAANSADPER